MKCVAALLFVLVSTVAVGAEEPPPIPGGGGGALSIRPPAVAGEVVCLGTAAAQEMVRDGRARRFAEIGHGLDGDLLRADLCRDADRLVYRVTVLDRSGRVRSLLVDAATGRMLYDGR